MTEAALTIGVFALLTLGLYFIVMRTTPGRGVCRVCDAMLIGIAVIYLLNIALSPLGAKIAENPVTTLASGGLGLPGVIISAVLSNVP